MAGITLSWLGPETDDLKLMFSHKALPTELVIKKSQLPREQQAGCARELLLAAIAECIVEWVLLSLRHAKIPIQQCTSHARLILGLTSHKIEVINLELQVAVADHYRHRAEKLVQSILRRGCLMTRSVTEGISVTYNLQFQ